MSLKAQQVAEYRRCRKQDLVNIMGGKCILCGYNKCIDTLEFHHIDPDEKEYQLSSGNCKSLEKDLIEVQKCALLCANCHREFHAGIILQEEIYCSFNNDLAISLVKNKTSIKNYCSCGKEIDRKAKACELCYSLAQRCVERPDRDDFKQLIRTQPFTQIGKQYGVTDNAIRKWCDAYNLPRTKKEINSYSDDAWKQL